MSLLVILRKVVKAELADDLMHTVFSNQYSAPFLQHPPLPPVVCTDSQVNKHLCSKNRAKEIKLLNLLPIFC